MKKGIKVIFIVLGVLLGIGIISAIVQTIKGSGGNTDSKIASSILPFNKDSIEKAILKDDSYKISKATIQSDSTINIYVTDPQSGVANYFETVHHLIDSTPVQEITVYYKNKLYETYGNKTGKIVSKFKEDNMIGTRCQNVEDAIKLKLNDPNSFEEVQTNVGYIATSGLFEVTVKFRAKNSFNATITNIAVANVSKNGTVLSMKIN